MKIDKSIVLAGIPIIKIRDFLRRHGVQSTFTILMIADYFGVSAKLAVNILKELVALGYVEISHSEEYTCTVKGNALAQVKFVKRMNRAKADRVFNDFMNRVYEVNNNDSFIYRVSKLILFGSYLNPDAEDYGDIDIAYKLDRKIDDYEEFEEQNQRIINNAVHNGKTFSSFFEEWTYSRDIVLHYLKNRSPYISLHLPEDIDYLSAPHRQIFP